MKLDKYLNNPHWQDLPTYVIAEIGVNHNGSLEMAKKMVDEAHAIGVDCVKFQTFKAEQIVTTDAPKARYQLESTDPQESQMAMLKALEMDMENTKVLMDYCTGLGLDFISTPYSFEDATALDEMGMGAFKVASAMLIEESYLKHLGRTGKPIILSTGMATLAEVDTAVRAIRSVGDSPVVILQCTTDYPAKVEDSNLKTVPMLADAFDCVSGYSDHTEGNVVCFAAVAIGAKVIEKHFTIDRNMEGPDQKGSSDPEEFGELVKGIRAVEAALGTAQKCPTERERMNMVGMRRSICLVRDMKQGEVIKESDLCYKRPATGIVPGMWDQVVGRQLLCDVDSSELLSLDHLGNA